MKFQKTIAATLSAAMLLSVSSFAATPSDFSDFPADWSTDALTHAVENGLLNGSDGKINAKGTLTRAQMAAIVNRAFGAEKAADLTRFVDMLQSAWYYNDMGKAVQMGTFVGSGDKLNPEAPITREQAFAVLARAFALSDGSASALSKFSDASSVSSWAVGSTAALVEAGYINGSDGKLNPKGYMTRAEFAQMMDNLVKAYVTSGQTITEVPAGNVVVRASGATLKNITVDGDLVIADGATSVTLDGVTVKGNIILRGGANGVTITGATSANSVTVENPNGTTVLNGDGSKLGTVHVKTDLTVNGTLSNASVDEKATLTVNKGGKVDHVTVNAPGSQVKGSGTVTTVQANASDTTVTTPNTKVTAGTGTSNVKAGDKTVDPGKTETVGTASSSGGSSSGGGSSRSDYSYVLMNIPYNEFYKAELSENAPKVDAVSSATMNKTRSGLAAGSYHVNTDGTDITGVIYPVRVKTSDLSGLTQVTDSSSVSITTTLKGKTSTTDYTGKDALFESASHSYYYLSSTPSYYKKATLTNGTWTFGKATGAAYEDTATIAKFKTSGHHADYEIKVESDKIEKGQKVYAVVVTDTDGNSYGLRHVAEIWHAIELGFGKDSALVGKTISAVTYYTDDGVIKLNLAEKLHVPVISGAKAEVAEPSADAESTTLTLSGFPKDFNEREVKVPEGMTYSNGTITFNSALPGSYTVKVSDTKGKYADVTASFTISTNKAAAQYDSNSVSLKAAEGANDAALANFLKNITSVKVGDKEYDATGKKAVTIINSNGYLDLTAKPFADMKSVSSYTITVKATGYADLDITATIPEHIYAYAAVPYDEYWQSEGVYLNEGSEWDVGSDELDGRKEYDKGAFDAVSRATTNHGLHRGSFQQSVVIHTDGRDYHPVSWSAEKADGGNVFLDADGKTYNKKEIGITSYNITGIKYVPVQVSSSDFVDFCKHYTVTQNGETLQGGYSEVNLSAYTAVAAVDSTTNGLKEVSKNNGAFVFGPRKSDGTSSGLKDTALAVSPAIDQEVVEDPGSYGEAIRLNINGEGYGALGAKMQTVVWTYYGDDSTRTTAVKTYGTKFAADNWMHRMMGIQLGLTDSARCDVLQTEKKGVGYWSVTIYALGYQDYTTNFEVTEANIVGDAMPMTAGQKEKLASLKATAENCLPEDYDNTYGTSAQQALYTHINEAAELIQKFEQGATVPMRSEAKEVIDELPGLIAAVKLAPVAGTYTELFPVLNDSKYEDYWLTLVAEKLGKDKTDAEVISTTNATKTACTATIYGQEAVDAYTDNPNSARFDCYFINDVTDLTFKGNQLSGKVNGKDFTYTYSYVDEIKMGGRMDGTLYKTNARNAGELTYLVMCADTPESTQHIEFRYGSDLNDLKELTSGRYAYWLAAGIPVNSDETFVKECIKLFVDENVEAPEQPSQPTTTELTGSYHLSKYDYDVLVKVVYDTTNNVIISVSDNGTNPTTSGNDGDDNSEYWDKITSDFYAKFAGKNKNQVAEMKMETGKNADKADKIDAVSGATYSSNAVKEAVLNALAD